MALDAQSPIFTAIFSLFVEVQPTRLAALYLTYAPFMAHLRLRKARSAA